MSSRSLPSKRTSPSVTSIGVAAGEDAGQRALAGAVGPHDGMDLAGVDLEVDAAEDFLVVDAGVEVEDGKH